MGKGRREKKLRDGAGKERRRRAARLAQQRAGPAHRRPARGVCEGAGLGERPTPPDTEWSRPAAAANGRRGCWSGGGGRGARWLGDGGRRHDACLLSMKTRGARRRRRRRRWRRRRRRGGEGGSGRSEEGEAGAREGGRA